MMKPGTGLAILFLAALAEFSAAAEHKRVCTGSADLGVDRGLRDRYINCTHVDGNLIIMGIQDDSFHYLKDIREVTGYVLFYGIILRRLVLPNLTIIRGQNLFNYDEEKYALLVLWSHMETLELPALREISSGGVYFEKNPNLCYMNTINWEEILEDESASIKNVYAGYKNTCPPCHETCERSCWGPGPLNCQKFSKINCSPQCHQRSCFGLNPRECCHSFCAGKCSGPKDTDCFACKYFDDNGVCKEACPSMRIYNRTTHTWEINPDGKYAYGHRCVKSCPEPFLRHSGACVRSCPEAKKDVDGECVACDGPCPKTCKALEIVHAGNIQTFKGCTIIEGFLKIVNYTFSGFVASDYGHPVFPKMHPDELEVFSTVKEVTCFVDITGYHPDFKNLSYFRNLEIVGGRHLTGGCVYPWRYPALFIHETSLHSLKLRSLREVRYGDVVIAYNPDLCFVEEIEWRRVMTDERFTAWVQFNAEREECWCRGLVCHEQCSSDGCWASGPDECLSCKSYKLKGTCVPSCNVTHGTYDAGSNICEVCDEECLGGCSGPGPSNCTQCRHARDGPYCVSECPIGKYNENGECKPCHESCANGCSGPRNTVGPDGCNSCDEAIVSAPDLNIMVQCQKADEPCSLGYYEEYIGPYEEGIMKSLTRNTVCQKCHRKCKYCTAYGVLTSVCDCLNYSDGEICVDACPRDYYADNTSFHCVKCSEECEGCHGPSSTECNNCRKYRVYLSPDRTTFNCTPSCPADKPHKIYDDSIDGPYCSDFDPALANSGMIQEF